MMQTATAGPRSIDNVCNPHGRSRHTLRPNQPMISPYPQHLQCHMHSSLLFPNHNFCSLRAMSFVSFDLEKAAGRPDLTWFYPFGLDHYARGDLQSRSWCLWTSADHDMCTELFARHCSKLPSLCTTYGSLFSACEYLSFCVEHNAFVLIVLTTKW